ncbi:EamA family transporter [Elizabethkingia argentiflava]|uniref:EamA family transporter n=1 Tax=Elizabethkingia argenteiflava TaxID=2681556 RepID=A0A845Q1C4_9FLAO|nr:DMT family transporter [Elizabethkingia argenteiflava]NAW52130.1 EamA family transporter [Elizabethkingia argenteiflava]
MENKNLYLILLILGTAFWGISFPVTKLSIGHFSQSTFLFYRFVLATISVAIIFSKHLKSIDKLAIKAGVSLAIPLTFAIYFQTLGLVKHTSASQCAFVAGMCVVIIPFIKTIFYKTKIEIKIWLAAILALLGLFIITINGHLVINIGDAYVLFGAIGFAYYLIKVEQYAGRKNIIPTLVPMFATAALIMLILSLFDGSSDWTPQNHKFWIGIIYCALFSTAYMYSVSNISQKYISSEKVAIIYLFDPIFAAIAAFFILNESLDGRLLCGGSLILMATIITEIKFKKMH